MYLAIDTSTSWTGLALAEDKGLIAEISWRTEQNQSVELLPNLTNLLKRIKREIAEVKGLCVALGPGSFNGLRVGLSTAKGLAYGLRIPVVGVSTLEATAYPFFHSGFNICPLQGAGREEVAVAIFRSMRGKWIKLLEEQIMTPEELCKYINKQTIFCGEIPEDAQKFLKEKLKTRAHFPHPFMCLRRPGNVLCLGLERLLKGEKDDPATLQPLYLRRPPITMSKKAKYGAFLKDSMA